MWDRFSSAKIHHGNIKIPWHIWCDISVLTTEKQDAGSQPSEVAKCGGLTPSEQQVHTKMALSLPSSTGQGRENTTKGSWIGIRIGREHSAITVMNKTNVGKKAEFIISQVRVE